MTPHPQHRTGRRNDRYRRTWQSAALAAVIVAAFAAAPAKAQTVPPADDTTLARSDTGRVRAGMEAPDFTLESFAGPRVTLSQFRGKKTVLLVFYRGHW